MLPKRTFYILGASFFFVSAFVLYFSFRGLTGFAISTTPGMSPDYTFALWFFISGIFLVSFPNLVKKEEKKSSK